MRKKSKKFLRLFMLRDANRRPITSNGEILYFSCKITAKEERSNYIYMTGDVNCTVSPGPDHHKFKGEESYGS